MANLVVLSIDDINLIEEQRAIACEKDDHIAIQVNEGCFHNLQYIMHNPDNSIRLRATRERVFVTDILYVPQLGSVFIAFNFGAFQMWNLMTLKLEFTSTPNSDGLPISHFGFLEPCDDPRAFCYLWVVYSSLDRHEEGFPLATMYALTYEGKTALNSGEYLYQNFITCNLRFNIELSSLETSNTTLKQKIGGRSLACHPITMSVGKPEDSDECLLNLCQIVWECWTVSAIAPVQSMMIIFDIDQWYKEQMPDCTVLETNSYLSVVNLGDTLSHTASSYLCDVRINVESLNPYFSVPRLEEHFYPNSLGYQCYCLTNTDITRLSTVGVQRQILATISDSGPSVLLQPAKLFQQCLACGLLPLYVEPTPALSTPVAVQRQVILSIALEARLLAFLAACARGPDAAALPRWAWARALRLKTGAERLALPLFRGAAPDAGERRCLDSCASQLAALAGLLARVVRSCAPLVEPQELKELKLKQRTVQVVALYFQVVQWFLNVGLLPEFDMEHIHDDNDERLPYPIESLIRYYQNRRYKLHCLNGENPAVENLQDKFCPLLFIDQFIKTECLEEKLKAFWIEDGSKTKGLYPPPSLHSLLKIYLIPEIKEEYKHYLVLYVLVDYATTFDDSRYEKIIRRLMQFPTMFGFSNTGLKITEAFWHLDHRDFDFALIQLQSLLAGGCLKQWQHNVVLSSLLAQKKTQSALQYLHVRNPYATVSTEGTLSEENVIVDDWQACCNLYLSRGLVLEGFNLIKESFNITDSADVRIQRLLVFFEGCRKAGLLSKTLLLPLLNDEEETLTNFLKALGDSESNNLLVMYYLQRSRYIEAQQVNEDLKNLTSKGQLPYDITVDFSMKNDHVTKSNTRNELVDLYCKTLPKITRCLAQLATSNVPGRKMLMPTPMTVSLQANIPKPAAYKSSIIQASINKANETWMERPTVARGLKRALQVEDTPFICTPKMSRHHTRLNTVETMITTPELEGTPAKRSRRDSEPELDTAELDPRLLQEVDSILHTPLVERKTSWVGSRSSLDRTSLREATPQSILKVRKILDAGNSSVDERHFAETDDELETASQHTQSDNLSRSIRFNIPSVGNTPSPSVSPDPNDNFNDISTDNYLRTRFITGSGGRKISPRKGIHPAGEFEAEMSLSATISTPVKHTPPRGRKLISASNSSVSSLNNSVTEDSCFTPVKRRNISQQVISDYVTNQMEDFVSQNKLEPDGEYTPSVSEDITLNPEDIGDYTQCAETLDENLIGSQCEDPPESPISKSASLSIAGPQPRRSLRNTPDKIIASLVQSPSNRRSLRSRALTPEPVTPINIRRSPAKVPPSQSKVKKSLARQVIEANALSVGLDTREISSVSKEEHVNIPIAMEEENVHLEEAKEISFIRTDSHPELPSFYSISNPPTSPFKTEESILPSYKHVSVTEVIEKTTIFSRGSFSTSNKTITSQNSTAERSFFFRNTSNTTNDLKKSFTFSVADKIADLSNSQYDNSLLVSDVSDAESDVSSLGKDPNNSIYRNATSFISGIVKESEKICDISNSSKINMDSSVFKAGTQLLSECVNPDKLDDSNSGSLVKSKSEYSDSVLVPESNYSDSCMTSNVDSNKFPSLVEDAPKPEKTDIATVTDVSNSDESSSANLVIDSESENKYSDTNKRSPNQIPSENIQGSLLQSDSSDDEENESADTSKENVSVSSSDHEDVIDAESGVESENDENSVNLGSTSDTNEDANTDNVSQKESSVNDNESQSAESEITNPQSNTASSESNHVQKDGSSDVSSEASDVENEEEKRDVEMECEDDESNLSSSSAMSQGNLFIEENSEDLANTAYLGNTSDVISIISSNDSRSKTDKSESVLCTENVTDKSIASEDVEELSEDVPKEVQKHSESTKVTESIKEVQPVFQEVNTTDLTSHPILEGVVFKIDSDKMDDLQSNKNICDPLDIAPVDDVHKTLTQEELNNMSLMTEDNSLRDESAISLKYSDEDNDSNHGKISKIINNNTDMNEAKSVNSDTANPESNTQEENNENQIKPKQDESIVMEVIMEDVEATPRTEKAINIISNESTPKKISRRRSSTSSRKSLAADKSLSESITEDLDTSVAMSTRSATKKKTASSKNEFDNVSLVSNASSRRSRRSESKLDTSFCSDLPEDDLPTPSSRKSRRSILTFAKPNLSIIPELSHVESEKSHLEKTDTSKRDSLMEYSTSRRLTRHQRSMLEKSMESTPGKMSTKGKKRRTSTQSNEGTIYEDSESEISESGEHNDRTLRNNLTEETIDPIHLLDKEDFKGEADLEEMNYLETASVSSMASSVALDFPPSTAARVVRASSEVSHKKTRRPSLDIVASPLKLSTPTNVLDESTATDSAGRPRRKSFNKAVEALSTPRRRRRPSTDSKNEDGASVSDTASDRGTPNVFRDARLSDSNQSKLLVIEEDEAGEEKGEPSPALSMRRKKKSASVDGYMMSPDMDGRAEEVRKARKARMSQLLTPLSQEEQLNVEDITRRKFRSSGANKMIQPLQFTVKKK